jgi:hypothetical protein
MYPRKLSVKTEEIDLRIFDKGEKKQFLGFIKIHNILRDKSNNNGESQS